MFFFFINSYDIWLIDWHSAIEIGSNVKYSGTLSTASNFILQELSKNSNGIIQSLPIDDVISLMKMILLEIIPKDFKDAISSEVRQGSYSGILTVYSQINPYFKNKQLIILKIIDLLEKNRQSLNKKELNYFIDQCLENHRCFILFLVEKSLTNLNCLNACLYVRRVKETSYFYKT